ncbi:MAG: hypothetical protein ACLQVK_20015 [Acidimicrobiales bacterium]|jgi:hypothetical protein
MTTALGAGPQPAVTPSSRRTKPGLGRRQRTREKVLAALVLLMAFVVTVVLLGLQWLGNQGTATSAPISASRTLISEVQAS